MWAISIVFRQFLTLLAFIPILPINSFNIDGNYPVIIQTVENGQSPTTPNYFGASTTFLKPDQGAHSWIVIGAPKANSTQHQDIHEAGAIWQCSLGRDPADVCTPVVMDPTGNYHNGDVHEWKNGSLLGGPNGMALSSKSFVACASRLERWVDGKGKRNTSLGYMHGSCYVRPKGHLLRQQQANNNDLGQSNDENFQRLNPLQDGLYEGKRKDRNGQAGFAVQFSKSGNELIMSAPGLERWMGSLIQYVSRDGGETFNKSFVSEATKCSASGIGCFNYLGYSVTSGYFYEKDVNVVNNVPPVYYAAGAPRANYLTGKVVIFRFPNDPKGSLEVQQEMTGNQTGAYFGSSLLSLDLNGDGYDDLVVGSPRFSRDQKQKPEPRGGRGRTSEPMLDGRGFNPFGGYGDEGAVFIYFSTNYGRSELHRQQKILHGENRPWSHFGTAFTSLGDLNRDGYKDFAVSAPYEDTSGAVYIYLGNKDGNIITHTQVIRGKRIDSGLRGFGFSLAGNEDIDNNGFNDISIGSFNSSQVVVLRAKPIITVHGVVKCSLDKLPLNAQEFQIESCVSFSGDYLPSSVQLKIVLLADANFRPHRVQIRRDGESDKTTRNFIEYTQQVMKSSRETCAKFHAIVTEPLETSGAPIVFRQSISIAQEAGESTVRHRTMKIQPKSGDMLVTGAKFSDFCKTCPVLNTLKPRSFDLQLPLAVPCGDDDRCQADLHLETFFRNVDLSSGRFVVGSSPSVTLEIQLSNSNETAIQPAVFVSWWKLKLKRNPADCSPYSEQGTQITYRCSFGKLLENGPPVSVSLEFDVTSLMVTESGHMETELFWNVTAHTVSDMAKPESLSVTLPLSYRADPYIDGSRRFETFNQAALGKYLVFTHTFEMSLDGPSPVADLKVLFRLPVNLTTEKSGSIVNVRGVRVDSGIIGTVPLLCQTTKGHFSKSDEALASEDDAEYVDPDFEFAGIGGNLGKDKDVGRGSNSSFVEKDRLLLHCNSPFVACMEVTCKQTVAVYNPGTTTVVTFVIDVASEDIRRLMKTHKVSSIQIESQGKLILGSSITEAQPTSNKPDETIAITLIEMEGRKPISKWLYILAVVVGFLILCCFGFCIYSCGCFEEKQPHIDENGETVVDGVVSTEEMQPLQEKVELQEEVKAKAADETNNESTVEQNGIGTVTDETNLLPISPFSDVTEPPEFVPSLPTEPTIPEELVNVREET